MFGRTFDLFTLFGVRIRVDLSWFIIALLITWTLATHWFGQPGRFPELVDRPIVTWSLAVLGAVLLFGSILLHELGHAKTAERFGLAMRGITLFIFGGVAEMAEEPPSARAEFWVAIAGPAVSVLLGVIGLGLGFALADAPVVPPPLVSLLTLFGGINLTLVVFNMIPAFPLDGGRVLRSAIWAYTGRLETATRITSSMGKAFGLLLMVLAGFTLLFQRDVVGAIWYFLIGMFLRNAAQMSYQRLLVRRQMEGEPLHPFLSGPPVAVHPQTPLDRVIHDVLYRYHLELIPVVDGSHRLVGCLTAQRIEEIERERWGTTTAGEVMEPSDRDNTIALDSDAMHALDALSRSGNTRLMVVDADQRLAGVVTLKELVRFLQTKIRLEGGPGLSH